MQKKSLSNEMFYIAYALLMATVMFSKVPSLNIVLSLFQIIGIALLSIVIILKNKILKKNTLVKLIFITIISLISYYLSRNSTISDSSIVMLILIVFAAKNIEFDKIVKFDLKIKLIFLIMVIALYFLGLTNGGEVIYRDGVARFSLGLGHANILGITMASIILEYIYLKREKINKLHLISLLIGLVVISYVTSSRGSLVLVGLMFLLVLFKKQIYNIVYKKNVRSIVINSFLLLIILSLFMTMLYSNGSSFGILLNNLFSNRLYYINNFINYYDLTLFGQNLIFSGSDAVNLYGTYTQILDNCFIYLILRFGIVSFVISDNAANMPVQ